MLKDGFFALQTPADMLLKLRHDFARCRDNPTDTFAAFDFVVTGTHMHDWAWKHGITERPTEPVHQVVFKLCEALGNGAKHFVMEKRRPKGHEIREGWVQPGWTQPGFADVGDLVVHLDAHESVLLTSPTITVLELAELVIAYWEGILES